MVAATAAHEIRSGAASDSHYPPPPLSPLTIFHREQEVEAFEADDFLWDGHALGLC